MSYQDGTTIKRVLAAKTWAVVGLTGHDWRAAYRVSRFLQQQGRRIVPVNPGAEPVHGEPGYARLADIPFKVDVVDIFRRSDQAGAHVDEAIEIGAGAVWLQLGVVDEEAAARADAAGLDVVMDTCPMIEWPTHG
jgi:predicted CoA-binding protein